jgi:hypothetical protein
MWGSVWEVPSGKTPMDSPKARAVEVNHCSSCVNERLALESASEEFLIVFRLPVDG